MSIIFKDITSVASLYLPPEGPVQKVFLDLSVYEKDLNAMEHPGFAELLHQRYGSLDQLNDRYQTLFKSFSAVASKQGFRVLTDKRPWLAAFDYKWCRHTLLAHFEEKVFAAPALQPFMPGIGKLPVASKKKAQKEGWGLCFDPVLLEGDSHDGFFPFAPGAYVGSPAAQAFRLAEFLEEKCRAQQVDFTLLPCFAADAFSPAAWPVLVCGKYLTEAAYRSVTNYLQEGGRALFACGAPHYQEGLERREWGSLRERLASQESTSLFLRSPVGAGWAWFPKEPLEFGPTFWPQLVDLVAAAERERT